VRCGVGVGPWPEIVNIATMRANFNPKKVTIVFSIEIGAQRLRLRYLFLK
jgi:hypothetical protein